MTRTAGHDGDGVSGAPEVITLSDDEFARLAIELTGGSFEGAQEAAETQTSTSQTLPTAGVISQGVVSPTIRRPTPVPSPRPGSGASGSFGTPSTSSGAASSTSATGSFGMPATSTGTSVVRQEPGHTGAFGTPAEVGGAGGGARRTGRAKPTVVRGSRTAVGDFFSNLPELWGLDLALVLVSIAGVAMIVTNLDTVLAAIAEVVFSILSGAMEIGMVILFAAIAIWFFFGRRRR